MPTCEVIDLLSSPEPPYLPTSNVPAKRSSRTINNVPSRSSPRRRAAAAAIDGIESAKHVQQRNLEDEFGSDLFASSSAMRQLENKMGHVTSGDVFGNIEAPHAVPNNANVETLDMFASSPVLPRHTHLKIAATHIATPIIEAKAQASSPSRNLQTEDLFVSSQELPLHKAIPAPQERREYINLSDDVEIVNEVVGVTAFRDQTRQENEDPFDLSVGQSKTDSNPHTLAAKTTITATKGQAEFLFLSDDFDTTADLNSPVASQGSAKRRRVSSSPEVRSKDVLKKTKASDAMQLMHSTRPKVGLKRASSDMVATSSKSGAVKESLRRAKSTVIEHDPITFTSSPDDVRVAKDRQGKQKRDIQKSWDDDEDIEFAHPLAAVPASVAKVGYPDPFDLSSDEGLPDINRITTEAISRGFRRVDSRTVLAEYNASKVVDQKTREKSRAAEEKLSVKDAEKERKKLAKEEKAREKQLASEVAKVNTLKTDKKTSSPEMIVDLPTGLDKKLSNQLAIFLGPLGIQIGEWKTSGSIKDVIRFRRKIEAKYNDELGHWEPVEKHVKAEPHVICILHAQEFVDLSTGPEGSDLDAHMLRIKTQFEDCEVLYLLEGLAAWIRKNRNVKNRQFVDSVRSQMAEEPGSGGAVTAPAATTSRRKKKAQEYVDEDMVEDSLLRLQVVHGALIHHSTSLVDTAQWIVALTQHISTIPYRKQKMALDTAFCMESGQVKTGDNPEDTFIKMLQEVKRITPSIAYGIASEYPSARKLSRAFVDNEGESGNENANGNGNETKDILMSLRKSSNKDGSFSDQLIGKRISRRVWGIFMGRDPGSTDV